MSAYRAPLDRTTPERSYQTDARYRAFVDMLEAQIHGAQMTPQEVRDAGMLAAIHYEMRHARPMRLALGRVDESGIAPGDPPNVVMVDGLLYRRDDGAGR